MKHSLWIVVALAIPAAAQQGLRPRPTSADYPVHQTAKAATIGAAHTKAFFHELGKHYVIVETGVFPEKNQTVKLATSDFALRFGDDLVYAMNPSTVAASLDRGRDRDPGTLAKSPLGNVHAATGVTYESGRDPVTGQKIHGWGTETEVSNEPTPQPPPPPQSSRNVQADVEDRALPEGETVNPVAGYLYFPVPSKTRKNAQYTLVYLAGDSPLSLLLPPEKR